MIWDKEYSKEELKEIAETYMNETFPRYDFIAASGKGMNLCGYVSRTAAPCRKLLGFLVDLNRVLE